MQAWLKNGKELCKKIFKLAQIEGLILWRRKNPLTENYKCVFSKDMIVRYIISCYIMGQLRLRNIDAYYIKHRYEGDRYLKAMVRRTEFKFYHRYFHYNVDHYQDLINNGFSKYYYPQQHLGVDEGNKSWRGHGHVKYMPFKSHKWGQKYQPMAGNQSKKKINHRTKKEMSNNETGF